MELGLRDKVVIVTGGARGIGAAIASGFVEEGANVIIGDTAVDLTGELAAKMKGVAKIMLVITDVTKKSDAKELVAKTMNEFGKIDILVNNAGGNVRKRALDVTWDDWNLVLDTNLRGPFFVAQSVARKMIPRRYGRIINIGSVTAVFGYSGLAPYCASRGGIKQLTMSLADDWGIYGITVNCLAPGWFKTEQTAVLYENKEWVAYITDRIPLRRPGAPNDLDGAIVFLASDASEYVTGQTWFVDGGISTGATRAILDSRYE